MPGKRGTPRERFEAKVSIEPNTGCWVWMGALQPASGYAAFRSRADGRNVNAHRFAYEEYRGPVPAGLVVDHLCRHRWCVNPHHLEAVPQRENVMRAVSPASVNANKTRCDHGHELFGENLYVKPSGERVCRECKRVRGRLWMRQHRQHQETT